MNFDTSKIKPDVHYQISRLADLLEIKKQTIYYWIRKDLIKSQLHITNIRIIKGEDVIKFLQSIKPE